MNNSTAMFRARAFGPPHVTPSVLKKIYNITTTPKLIGEQTSNSSNKQTIVSFLGQTFSPVVECVGPISCEGSSEAEASLDIQYLTGISPHVPTEGWYFNGQTLDFGGTVVHGHR